ncbi:helix-turn-helix domain-containing protein [Streptomyces prasinus]|uniref:helix-turn-helix domain-containing protein n=1 Tax=Streptomyces prasinus TaxID=67345 RepID=UPI0036B7E663
MTTDHRAEAERLLASADTAIAAALEKTLPLEDQQHAAVLTGVLTNRALGHAMLAADRAATADISSLRHAIHTYRFALIRQVAEGLTLSEGDEAHRHALGLARFLDSVDLNIDREVDAYIDELGWGDPRDAWLCPTARRAKWDAEMPDPWATPAPRDETASRRDEALKADPSAWEMLGRAIRKERERQQLSRRALSERAEVSEKAIQTAEEGRVPASRWPQSLNRITTALGMGPGVAVDIVLSAYPDDPPF